MMTRDNDLLWIRKFITSRDNFSEDVDVVVLRHEGENDNQMKNKIRTVGKIVESVMPEINIPGLTNKRGNIRKTVHQYDKIFIGSFGEIRENIVFEATWLGSFEPFTIETINTYVAEMMKQNGQDELIKEYVLKPFELPVLSKERTLCEKIMSLARFSLLENPHVNLANKIRHTYDIHMMLKNISIREFFVSNNFDKMMITVGNDDLISYKNNNEWLKTHPAEAIIYKEPEDTWNKIRTPYQTTFMELITGNLPREKEIVETLKEIHSRLLEIEWTINV